MATLLKVRQSESRYEVNIGPHHGTEGAWNVEAIDGDGAIQQAIFAGPSAEERARRYAAMEYPV
jgi:hypothetical protein